MKKPREIAYNFLSYRARSKKEMKDRLKREGCDKDSINEIIYDLERWGYLDDYDAAYQWAFSWAKKRGWGSLRIAHTLKQRGIPSEIVASVLKKTQEEFTEEEIARSAMEKKFKRFSFSGASEKEKRKVIEYLKRKGFSFEVISLAIRGKQPDSFTQ